MGLRTTDVQYCICSLNVHFILFMSSYACVSAVPTNARRGCWIPWSWNCRCVCELPHVGAETWMLVLWQSNTYMLLISMLSLQPPLWCPKGKSDLYRKMQNPRVIYWDRRISPAMEKLSCANLGIEIHTSQVVVTPWAWQHSSWKIAVLFHTWETEFRLHAPPWPPERMSSK